MLMNAPCEEPRPHAIRRRKVLMRVALPSPAVMPGQGAEWSLSHSRNASFIRVCHPAPPARKAARTSRSIRMATCSLEPVPEGRPRPRRDASTPARSSSSVAGRSSSSLPSQTKCPPAGRLCIAFRICSLSVIFLTDPVIVGLRFFLAGVAKADDARRAVSL